MKALPIAQRPLAADIGLLGAKPRRIRFRHGALPAALRLWLGLATATTALISTLMVSAVVLAGLGAQPGNPFATFADVFPGKSAQAALQRGFFCERMSRRFSGQPPPLQYQCSYTPSGGEFHRVWVIMSSDRVLEIIFHVKPGRLAVGDLPDGWGRPRYRFGRMQWQDNAVNAIPWTHSARFDFFLPIRFISFTDTRVIETAPPSTMPGQYG